MGYHINVKYGKMYKDAYNMGLIEELRELHPVNQTKPDEYRIWKNTIRLEKWVMRWKLKLLDKGYFYSHGRINKLSEEKLIDLIRNISIFFTYVYDSNDTILNMKYINKFDELMVQNGIVDVVDWGGNPEVHRPYMNEDMMSATIQCILFGHSLEQQGNELLIEEYAFQKGYWQAIKASASTYYDDFFIMNLINESFSINWPSSNPLNSKN